MAELIEGAEEVNEVSRERRTNEWGKGAVTLSKVSLPGKEGAVHFS
jgi:hypothetical protein